MKEPKQSAGAGMRRVKRVVWVVMHYEIMGTPEAPRVDSIQFHVSSTRARAEEYIKSNHVDSHSWWQVHPHVVDTNEFLHEGEEVHYYSHRGSRLKAAPMIRAITAFRKHVARYPEFYSSRSPEED